MSIRKKNVQKEVASSKKKIKKMFQKDGIFQTLEHHSPLSISQWVAREILGNFYIKIMNYLNR